MSVAREEPDDVCEGALSRGSSGAGVAFPMNEEEDPCLDDSDAEDGECLAMLVEESDSESGDEEVDNLECQNCGDPTDFLCGGEFCGGGVPVCLECSTTCAVCLRRFCMFGCALPLHHTCVPPRPPPEEDEGREERSGSDGREGADVEDGGGASVSEGPARSGGTAESGGGHVGRDGGASVSGELPDSYTLGGRANFKGFTGVLSSEADCSGCVSECIGAEDTLNGFGQVSFTDSTSEGSLRNLNNPRERSFEHSLSFPPGRAMGRGGNKGR